MLALVWTIGFSINLLLLTQLLLRPRLWSTTNVYSGVLLGLNSSYMLCVLIINDDGIEFNDNDIISLLELLYTDQYRPRICCVKYFLSFFHTAMSLYLIELFVFLRLMMIKRAPDIRQEKHECKKHQAHLGSIGFLVGIVGVTCIIGKMCFFMIDPHPSFEYILVLPCRGLVKHHSDEEKRKITSTWFIRVMIQILMLFHTIACHGRVRRFKRSHNSSYYRKVRQNINTYQETLAASYLLILGSLAEEVAFFSLIHNLSLMTKPSNVYDSVDILSCIVLPIYWLFSTKQKFPEFWSTETLFWRKPRIRPTLSWSTGPFEPRRPLPKLESSGRFSYNLNLNHFPLQCLPSESPVSSSLLLMQPLTMSLDQSMAATKSSLKVKYPHQKLLSPCSPLGSSLTSLIPLADIQASSAEFSYPLTPSPLFERPTYLSQPFSKLESSGRFSYNLNLNNFPLPQLPLESPVPSYLLSIPPLTLSPSKLPHLDQSIPDTKSSFTAKFPHRKLLTPCLPLASSSQSLISLVDIQDSSSEFSYPSTPSPMLARPINLPFYLCRSPESFESQTRVSSPCVQCTNKE